MKHGGTEDFQGSGTTLLWCYNKGYMSLYMSRPIECPPCLLSCRQGPLGRACWKRGYQSKYISIHPPKNFGIHPFNSNPPHIHVLHHLLPGLVSLDWSIHALHVVLVISIRNKSDHISPITSFTLIVSVTLHCLRIKPASSTVVTFLQFWPVFLYQGPPLSTTLMLPLCLHIFQPKDIPHCMGNGNESNEIPLFTYQNG